ncbi:hypothetical protein BH11BAC3_BH11BAC3_14910 [soil metagenome]
MKLLTFFSILIFSGFLFSPKCFAQGTSISRFDELSRFSMAKQKDSIKKAWVCPSRYKDKEKQKKYAEIWNSRTDFLLNAIQANHFIYNKPLVEYVDGIIQQIKKSNPDIIQSPLLLLIDRSESVNAYSLGNNVIAVNLGLICYAQNREELALVIAHELAHNILGHSEMAMKLKAELLTSDDFKESLNDVLNSKYGRLTRLKEILKGYSFSRSKHSRYKESEADSLAVVMLKKSMINFDANNFLRLDSSDNEYRSPLLHEAKSYFTSFNFPVEDQWFIKKSKGLSTRSYNFSKGEDLTDSLKTHPDCVERFNLTKGQSTIGASFTPLPVSLKETAEKMIVWNLYDNMNLTPALYRILLLRDKGATDPWFDIMTYNIFAGLYYADKQLSRFNSIGVIPKEYISKDYFAVQTMLEQIPSDNLSSAIKSMSNQSFWSGASTDSKGFKAFLNSLIFSETISKKEQERYSKEFIHNYPTSMYAEVADKF